MKEIFENINCIVRKATIYIFKNVRKDYNVFLFGSWFGIKYSDNPKALYEYCLKNCQNKKIFWITKNKEIYKQLKRDNLPVLMHNSIKGIYYQLKAGVVFYCTSSSDLASRLLGGAIHINLWHGVGGGKKIGYDLIKDKDSLKKRLFDIEFHAFKKKYYVCTSEDMIEVFLSAFETSRENIILAGQPRNDIFYDKEYSFKTLDAKTYRRKKIISYLPTHRKEGKQKINCSDIFDLQRINSFCEDNNFVFLIKKHFYHRNEIEDLEEFSRIIDITNEVIDINELLMLSSYVISDYSSVTADYLLLNKPIIYYCYDINDYLNQDRELYWPYEDITPGEKAYSFDELSHIIHKLIIEGKDEYYLERNKVCDKFYDKLYSQCPACERILDNVNKIIERVERK